MASSSSGSSWFAKQRKALREQVKKLPTGVVIAVGSVLLVVGVILLIIPGPGIPFVALGVTLLASRVPWVGRLAHAARKKISRVRRKLKRKFDPPPKHPKHAHE